LEYAALLETYSFFKKDIFIYLRGREREKRESEQGGGAEGENLKQTP